MICSVTIFSISSIRFLLPSLVFKKKKKKVNKNLLLYMNISVLQTILHSSLLSRDSCHLEELHRAYVLL